MFKKFFTTWKAIPVHLLLVSVLSYAFISYFFQVKLPNDTLHGHEIEVPSLENLTIEEAIAAIEKADLNYVIKDTTFSDAHKKNAVISHIPKAGDKVKKDRKIYLTVNADSDPLVHIDCTEEWLNNGIASLKERLKAEHLNFGRRIDTFAPQQKGYIFRLEIKGKPFCDTTLTRGSTINAVIGVDAQSTRPSDSTGITITSEIDSLTSAIEAGLTP